MDKHKLIDNVCRDALAQGTGTVVTAGFGAIMTAMGAPQSFLMPPITRCSTRTCVDKI